MVDTKLKEDTVGRIVRMSPDKENIESTEIEYSGLCSTCMHAPSCFNLMRSEDPILFCEEFDISPNLVLQTNPVSLGKNSAPDDKHDTHMPLCLCINCEHKELCTLPMPEGGVWHCEEFE